MRARAKAIQLDLPPQLARARYLALIKQVFNPDEALRPCTLAIAV